MDILEPAENTKFSVLWRNGRKVGHAHVPCSGKGTVLVLKCTDKIIWNNISSNSVKIILMIISDEDS